MDCVFCKIANGEIPSKKAYEDEKVCAFFDLDPQAPVHILIIPKEHITSVAEITPENSSIIAHIFEVAAKLAEAVSYTHLDVYKRQLYGRRNRPQGHKYLEKKPRNF